MPSAASARQVRIRAADRCEYCRFPQVASRLTFAIDHIVARQHLGTDDLDNLALACTFCNGSKGPNLSGIDPSSGRTTRLYHRRRDRWPRHFEWSGLEIVGRMAVGRVTVVVLALNRGDQVNRRRAVAADGVIGFRGRRPQQHSPISSVTRRLVRQKTSSMSRWANSPLRPTLASPATPVPRSSPRRSASYSRRKTG